MRTGAVLSAVLLTLSLGADLAADAGAPSGRSPAGSVITLHVLATDRAHLPVHGLTAADFEITEDGRPVSIESSAAVDASTDGRTYLMAVDALHLSPRGAARVQVALEQFVNDFFGPHDRGAVAWLGRTPRISGVTNDRQQLLGAIGVASTAARSSGAGDLYPLGVGAAAFSTSDALDSSGRTFAALTTALERVPHGISSPVAVLLISGGVPEAGASRATSDARRALLAEAARANASIYPIDPAGMAAIRSSLSPGDESEPAGLAEWASLRTIAESTGGRAILGQSDLAPAYRQIVQDNTFYYVISFVSAHAQEHDGDFHNVRVRVKRAGVTLTTRKGWYEPAR